MGEKMDDKKIQRSFQTIVQHVREMQEDLRRNGNMKF
jgi:hypothetical protein